MGEKINDYTKSNQSKLSPSDLEKARTEPHPLDETPQATTTNETGDVIATPIPEPKTKTTRKRSPKSSGR